MIQALNLEYAEYIASHQQMYPPEMREEASSFQSILASTPFNYGWFEADTLIGWALCSAEVPCSPCQVYWYDLAVLEQFQGKGVAKALMAHAYADLRWHGQWIRMHTRKATYPRHALEGYRIVRDIFIPHHYLSEYGIDEDAHELLLAPA